MPLIFKTKFHDWFPRGQFFIEGYHTPFSLDQDGNGGGILLYSARSYQLETSAMILQHLKAFMLKLFFIT